MKDKTMTIYTIYSVDICPMKEEQTHIAGSYESRGRAIDELVDYIIERIENGRIAFAFANDINHDGMNGVIEEEDNGDWQFTKKTEAEVRAFLRDEIGGNGIYRIYCESSAETYIFNLEEHDLILG